MAMTIAVGTVSSLALTACSSSGTSGTGGTGSKTPAEALSAGVSKLSDGKAASFEISLQPDAAAIAAMNKDETDPKAAAVAQKLFSNGGLDIKVTVSADKALKDIKAGDTDQASTDIAIKAGGTDFLDLRTVKGALYLKVDVPDVAALSGQSASSLSALTQNPEIPATLQPAIQAIMAGKWVGVSAEDLKSVEQLAQTFGGTGDLSASPSSPDQTQISQFTTALVTALSKDATITDKGSGQLEITGKVKTLAQDLLQSFEPLLSALPSASKTDLDKTKESLNSIPDTQTITFDAWLSGGALTEIKIDVLQFAKPSEAGGGHMPLDAKFSNSAPAVSVPDGVTNIDVKSVLGSLQGL
jgi:hypothetical protein